jgi:hypothetical protein
MLRRPERTPQGFLRVEGYASRCGVFEYLNEDGTTRRELRLPEEVFAPAAMTGFETAILTDGHPSAMVTTENVKRVDVGHVIGAARRDGDHVATSILITDPNVIAKVELGDTGLSVGYGVDLDETPGVHPVYGRYDAIQRNLVINHLAVAVTPRAGDTARIRMDGASVLVGILDGNPPSNVRVAHRIDPCDRGDETGPTTKELAPMADDKEIKTDDDLAEARAMIAQLEKEVVDLKEKLSAKMAADEAEAVKAEKERADKAEARIDEMIANQGALVRARAAAEATAVTVMGATYRCDDKDDVAIQRDVVKRLDPSIDVNGITAAELRGHFKQLVARHTRAREDYADAARVLSTGTGTGTRTDNKPSYEDIENNRWKLTLSKGRAAAAEGR